MAYAGLPVGRGEQHGPRDHDTKLREPKSTRLWVQIGAAIVTVLFVLGLYLSALYGR